MRITLAQLFALCLASLMCLSASASYACLPTPSEMPPPLPILERNTGESDTEYQARQNRADENVREDWRQRRLAEEVNQQERDFTNAATVIIARITNRSENRRANRARINLVVESVIKGANRFSTYTRSGTASYPDSPCGILPLEGGVNGRMIIFLGSRQTRDLSYARYVFLNDIRSSAILRALSAARSVSR